MTDKTEIPIAVLDQIVRQQEELADLKTKMRELVEASTWVSKAMGYDFQMKLEPEATGNLNRWRKALAALEKKP